MLPVFIRSRKELAGVDDGCQRSHRDRQAFVEGAGGPLLAGSLIRPRVAVIVVLGLVIGKTVGIFAGTYLAARFTRARLNPTLAWAEVFALAVLTGIGFTVALLIAEVSFPDPADAGRVKAAVLLGCCSPRAWPRCWSSAVTASITGCGRRRTATRTPTTSPTSTSRARTEARPAPGVSTDRRTVPRGNRAAAARMRGRHTTWSESTTTWWNAPDVLRPAHQATCQGVVSSV